MTTKDIKPSVEQSKSFQMAYDYLNETLFDNKLPKVMLVLSRNKNIIGGYFIPEKWESENGSLLHEICLNCNLMELTGRDINKLMEVITHEMIHVFQHETKSSGKNGYHNKAFARLSKAMGFIPFNPSTGGETGYTVTTNINTKNRNSPFLKAMIDLPPDAIFPFMSFNQEPPGTSQGGGGGGGGGGKEPPKPKKGGSRKKYSCPICGINAWAKHDIKILCVTCSEMML